MDPVAPTTSLPPLTVVVPVYVLAPVSTHVPAPALFRLVALVDWSVTEMPKVLAPAFVPVRLSVRVPAVSNRLMLGPAWVKLRVADGSVPEASIVGVRPLMMRISRLVLCGVEPVY